MQAVRDEILNIMHRNNIGEKRGTWMEDWHQKLHNNTTPDDVAICEAFIAFLKSEGDRGAYWSVLSDAGRCPLQHMSMGCDLSVPRERLLHQQGVWQGFGLKCMPLAGMAHVCMDSQRLMAQVSAAEPLCSAGACIVSPVLSPPVIAPAGITRERLESFDRPIKVEPEDYPDKRDALIGEFQNYLGILKVLPPPSHGRPNRPHERPCAVAVWECCLKARGASD